MLRTADGWVHPGPPTAWSAFTDMALTIGAPIPGADAALPDLTGLTVDAVDAEAAAWLLPAAAVRTTPAPADSVPEVGGTSLTGAHVVVLGTAWATPLVGRMLADLGAQRGAGRSTRSVPIPSRSATRLVRGQERIAVDLGGVRDRDRLRGALVDADLLVDGHPPRVLGNAGLGVEALTDAFPRCPSSGSRRSSTATGRGTDRRRRRAVAGPPATTRPASVARRSPTRWRGWSARSWRSSCSRHVRRATALASRWRARWDTCSARERSR